MALYSAHQSKWFDTWRQRDPNSRSCSYTQQTTIHIHLVLSIDTLHCDCVECKEGFVLSAPAKMSSSLMADSFFSFPAPASYPMIILWLQFVRDRHEHTQKCMLHAKFDLSFVINDRVHTIHSTMMVVCIFGFVCITLPLLWFLHDSMTHDHADMFIVNNIILLMNFIREKCSPDDLIRCHRKQELCVFRSK